MMTSAKPKRYPIWSVRVILLISVPVIVTITLLVFILSTRSVFVESQITVAIVALCLFVFLTTGLYRGVRLERPAKDELDRTIQQFESKSPTAGPHPSDVFGFLFSLGPPSPAPASAFHVDLPGLSDAGDDLVGCLITLGLWIGVLVLIAVLAWLLVQFIAALPVFAAVLYWVFYRALRVVFAKSRACRGRLLRSVEYGLLYTLLYTGWILALLTIGRFLIPTA